MNIFHIFMRLILFIRVYHFFFFNQDAKLKFVYEAADKDEYWLTLISLNLNTKFSGKTVN